MRTQVEPIMAGHVNFYSLENDVNGDGKIFQKTVVLAVDGSEQAEKAVDCKSGLLYFFHYNLWVSYLIHLCRFIYLFS
jgi:hypothetical protein